MQNEETERLQKNPARIAGPLLLSQFLTRINPAFSALCAVEKCHLAAEAAVAATAETVVPAEVEAVTETMGPLATIVEMVTTTPVRRRHKKCKTV